MTQMSQQTHHRYSYQLVNSLLAKCNNMQQQSTKFFLFSLAQLHSLNLQYSCSVYPQISTAGCWAAPLEEPINHMVHKYQMTNMSSWFFFKYETHFWSINPSPLKAASHIFAVQRAMLTHHTRLTGIWGAGVPRRILLQHSVGDQTTGHQSRWSITFNPLQAPGYPLLSVRNKSQKIKVNSCSVELIFMKLFRRLYVKIQCSEPWRYLFIPKSFVTAPSKYFFNSETEY